MNEGISLMFSSSHARGQKNICDGLQKNTMTAVFVLTVHIVSRSPVMGLILIELLFKIPHTIKNLSRSLLLKFYQKWHVCFAC